MARFDKVDPRDGSYRAPLGFAITSDDVGDVVGVSIDGSGTVQRGTGGNGFGVICPSSIANIGDPIDVMTDGEIVDLTGLTAGQAVGAGAADGVLGPGEFVGFTVQAWRLIVRAGRGGAVV